MSMLNRGQVLDAIFSSCLNSIVPVDANLTLILCDQVTLCVYIVVVHAVVISSSISFFSYDCAYCLAKFSISSDMVEMYASI